MAKAADTAIEELLPIEPVLPGGVPDGGLAGGDIVIAKNRRLTL
jgi:hypothetical protein